MTSTTVLVEGMTCQHCVGSVSTELMKLEGVTGVEVELRSGGASTVAMASTTRRLWQWPTWGSRWAPEPTRR